MGWLGWFVLLFKTNNFIEFRVGSIENRFIFSKLKLRKNCSEKISVEFRRDVFKSVLHICKKCADIIYVMCWKH